MTAADPSFIRMMRLVSSAVLNRQEAERQKGNTAKTLARLAVMREREVNRLLAEGLAPLAANSER